MAPPEDDRALVERARENDCQAYEQLYRKHVGRVFALCVRMCRDQDVAEDLTQDAFVQAWRKLRTFRGDSAFGSWLYRIATNTVLSYLRGQKSFVDSLKVEHMEELTYRETPLEQIGLERAIALLPEGGKRLRNSRSRGEMIVS